MLSSVNNIMLVCNSTMLVYKYQFDVVPNNGTFHYSEFLLKIFITTSTKFNEHRNRGGETLLAKI